MAHVHEMRDSDKHYVVDPITRTVRNNDSGKSVLIQYDHKSEILTFEMPRYIEGHDMTKCNRVEVHYDNIGSGVQNHGVYEVEDFEISEDEEETIVWSWVISNAATQYVGSLSFAFRFACLTDTVVDYAWSTSPYSGIVVNTGIYNSEEVIEECIDILEQWERKIGVGIGDVEQTIEATEPNGINVITLILTDGREESFFVRNGYTPIRGTDYWTEEDKQAIIDEILGVIPIAEEASF